MPVKSLVDLATTACLKNIRELQSVGDYLPYENVRHILMQINNAHQLRTIEINSPHIEGETGEIWLKLIAKEFPLEYKAKAYKPQNPKNWFRVWEKYKRDHDRALEESERKLMSAMGAIQENKEKNTSKIVDRRLLPSAGRVGPKRTGWGQRDSATSTLNFTRGSRTKTATGASVMRKVRRETKEIASIHGALSRPVRGPAAITPVNRAPASMVNDYRRAAQPVYRPTKAEPSDAVTEYEERATFLSDSEDGDDSNGDSDPLFDEGAAPKPSAKSSTPAFKKRPIAPTSKPPGRATGTSSSSAAPPKPPLKRSGILSNNYKPSASKPKVVSAPTTSDASPPKASSPPGPKRTELPKAAEQTRPPQSSPPPSGGGEATSPPPAAGAAPPAKTARKRKAVDIFMKRKKPAH